MNEKAILIVTKKGVLWIEIGLETLKALSLGHIFLGSRYH
jgi:hypothetical protein